jgi:hypothetical protein
MSDSELMSEWKLLALLAVAILYPILLFIAKFWHFAARFLDILYLFLKAKGNFKTQEYKSKIGSKSIIEVPRVLAQKIIMLLLTVLFCGIIYWATDFRAIEIILFGTAIYAIALVNISRRRRKLEYKLIEEYSLRLNRKTFRGLGFIDFLMIETIPKKRFEINVYAEILLDYLLDKRNFIKAHIARIPKRKISHKIFSFVVNESIYIRIRNDSIRELLNETGQSLWEKVQFSNKPTTIVELKKLMLSKANRLKKEGA